MGLIGEVENKENQYMIDYYSNHGINFAWQADHCLRIKQDILNYLGRTTTLTDVEQCFLFFMTENIIFQLIEKGYIPSSQWLINDFLKWKSRYYPQVAKGQFSFISKLGKQYLDVCEKRYLRNHPWG